MPSSRALAAVTLGVSLALFSAPAAAQGTEDKSSIMMDELGDPGAGMEGALDPAKRGAKLTLQFVDAVTGNPIPGASVTFMNSRATTDVRGMARFPFPKIPDSKDISIPAIFSKSGQRVARGASLPEGQKAYVTSKVPVHFMVGTVWNHRFSISPAMAPGKLRIVLDWGERPRDLDAHLIKGGQYHISYRKMRSYRDRAFLDRDDVDGHGPETITIERVDDDASYAFYVHDYTNRSNKLADELGRSKARVMVFGAKELLGTYLVPSGAGITWKVFEISGGYPRAATAMGSSAPR